MLQGSVIDVAYMCLMPSFGFIVGLCVMGALYEGTIIPQRVERIRLLCQKLKAQADNEKNLVRLAESRAHLLTRQITRSTQRRDKKGRFAA